MVINYNFTHFLTSSVDAKCIHVDQNGLEIVFIGYSNAGKSSLINCLTNKSKLARYSKSPGQTKMINFFKVNTKLKLVDLPGYGYSLINKGDKRKLYNLIINYLTKRCSVKKIILLVDIRRLIRSIDKIVLKLSNENKIDLIILLTKCDKINKMSQKYQLSFLKKQLFPDFKNIKIFIFSSFKKIGLDNLFHKINEWYNTFYNI